MDCVTLACSAATRACQNAVGISSLPSGISNRSGANFGPRSSHHQLHHRGNAQQREVFVSKAKQNLFVHYSLFSAFKPARADRSCCSALQSSRFPGVCSAPCSSSDPTKWSPPIRGSIGICRKRKAKRSEATIEKTEYLSPPRAEAVTCRSEAAARTGRRSSRRRVLIWLKPGLIDGGCCPKVCRSRRPNFKHPQQPIREQVCRRTPDMQQAP